MRSHVHSADVQSLAPVDHSLQLERQRPLEPDRQPHGADKQEGGGRGKAHCPQHQWNILLTLAGLQHSSEPGHGLTGGLLQRLSSLWIQIAG